MRLPVPGIETSCLMLVFSSKCTQQTRPGKLWPRLLCAFGRVSTAALLLTIRYIQPAPYTARPPPTCYPRLPAAHQVYRLHAAIRSDDYVAGWQAYVLALPRAGGRDNVLQSASHKERGSPVFLLSDGVHLTYFICFT